LTNGVCYAKDSFTDSFPVYDPTCLSTVKNVKSIRPRYDQDGERAFILNSSIVKLRLVSNSYTFISTLQTNLSFIS